MSENMSAFENTLTILLLKFTNILLDTKIAQ